MTQTRTQLQRTQLQRTLLLANLKLTQVMIMYKEIFKNLCSGNKQSKESKHQTKNYN